MSIIMNSIQPGEVLRLVNRGSGETDLRQFFSDSALDKAADSRRPLDVCRAYRLHSLVALGTVNIGAFTNNEELLQKVLSSAKTEGEKMWTMPMDEEYKEQPKTPYADLANIGGRPGGSITAAWFLKEFSSDLPWVHLDIAGTAWLDESKAWMAKGPTGTPLRTLTNLAMNW